MKRLPRAMVALGCGAGIFLGVKELTDHSIPPREETNQIITLCANHLGKAATEASSLPVACKGERLADNFQSQEITYATYSSAIDDMKEAHLVAYTLPSRADFIRKNIVTVEDIARAREHDTYISGALAVMGVVLTELTIVSYATQRHDDTLELTVEAAAA